MRPSLLAFVGVLGVVAFTTTLRVLESLDGGSSVAVGKPSGLVVSTGRTVQQSTAVQATVQPHQHTQRHGAGKPSRSTNHPPHRVERAAGTRAAAAAAQRHRGRQPHRPLPAKSTQHPHAAKSHKAAGTTAAVKKNPFGLPKPSQVTVGTYNIPRISSALYDRFQQHDDLIRRERIYWMMKGEMFVHQRLQSWEGYTHLRSAHLKFVPYYSSAQAQSRRWSSEKEVRFTEWAGVESIIRTKPLFQARQGTDHIYFLSYDYGGCMTFSRGPSRSVPEWVRRGIIASTLGDKHLPNCFRLDEDIVAPPALKWSMVNRALKWLRIRFPRTLAAIARAKPRRGASRLNNRLTDADVTRLSFPRRYPRELQQEAAHDDKRRRRLTAFRGQVWHSVRDIRKKITKLQHANPHWTTPTVGADEARRATGLNTSGGTGVALRPGEEDIPIPHSFFAPVTKLFKNFILTEKLSAEDTAVDMWYTHFCLCPAGHAPWSPRPFQAMLAGCIPVLLSDDIIMPFGEILNWDELSVRIPEAKVNSTYSILSSIPPGRRQTLRLNIVHALPYLMLLERRLNETEAPGWGREDAFDIVMHLYVQRWLRRCRKNATACVG